MGDDNRRPTVVDPGDQNTVEDVTSEDGTVGVNLAGPGEVNVVWILVGVESHRPDFGLMTGEPSSPFATSHSVR